MHGGSQKVRILKMILKENKKWGAWVGHSVKQPASAQAMISMSSRPLSASVLTAKSLEPVSGSVSPSLSALPPHTLCLSLSKINIKKKNLTQMLRAALLIVAKNKKRKGKKGLQGNAQ